jgi:hypothetical protein
MSYYALETRMIPPAQGCTSGCPLLRKRNSPWAALVSRRKPRFALAAEDEGRQKGMIAIWTDFETEAVRRERGRRSESMPEDGCKQIGI